MKRTLILFVAITGIIIGVLNCERGDKKEKIDQPYWTNYTVTNGLINDNVGAIAIDNQNNIWFGCRSYPTFLNGEIKGGLMKYDGTSWEHYATSSGFPFNSVDVLYIDSENNLWIGSNCGLSKFNGDTFSFINYPGGSPIYCTSITKDSHSNVWIADPSGYGQVSKFDGTNWLSFTTLDGIADCVMEALAIDNKENIWLATDKGLSKYDGIIWTNYTRQDVVCWSPCALSVAVDSQDKIWFGYSGGVMKFDGKTWTEYLNGKQVNTIKIDNKDNLWFGTNEGVARFDGISWKTYTTADGLVNDEVNTIAIDNQGNLWFGTNGGVSKFSGEKF